MPEPQGPELLTAKEVALELRVSASTVRNWRYRGLLTAIVLPGGSLRFTREEVDRIRRIARTGAAKE